MRASGPSRLCHDAHALQASLVQAANHRLDLRRDVLYDERFVCIVRRGHPLARRKRLSLEAFAAAPQLLISITDERSAGWVDEALAREGLTRRIAMRTRYFMAAPLIVAQSDLLATCPYQLARYFAARAPIAILEPPIVLPKYSEFVVWHERYDSDPALRWLRGVLADASRTAIERG